MCVWVGGVLWWKGLAHWLVLYLAHMSAVPTWIEKREEDGEGPSPSKKPKVDEKAKGLMMTAPVSA